MTAVTESVVYTIYVHERGKRPRAITTTGSDAFPTEWRDGDRTLFFVCADLVARTATYTDVRPSAATP